MAGAVEALRFLATPPDASTSSARTVCPRPASSEWRLGRRVCWWATGSQRWCGAGRRPRTWCGRTFGRWS